MDNKSKQLLEAEDSHTLIKEAQNALNVQSPSLECVAILWSRISTMFGSFSVPYDVLSSLIEITREKLKYAHAPFIASVLDGLAKLLWNDNVLVEECVSAYISSEIDVQNLSTVLYSLSVLGHFEHGYRVVDAADRANTQLQFVPESSGMIMWSCAILGKRAQCSSLYHNAYMNLKLYGPFSLPKQILIELHQAILSEYYLLPNKLWVAAKDTGSKLHLCAMDTKIRSLENVSMSSNHNALRKVIQKYNINHVCEYRANNVMSIDVAVPKMNIAIECDGPGHFVSDTYGNRNQTGPTKLRNTLLEAMGWRVFVLPCYYQDGNKRQKKARQFLERHTPLSKKYKGS